jgi:hypothetical protein
MWRSRPSDTTMVGPSASGFSVALDPPSLKPSSNDFGTSVADHEGRYLSRRNDGESSSQPDPSSVQSGSGRVSASSPGADDSLCSMSWWEDTCAEARVSASVETANQAT